VAYRLPSLPILSLSLNGLSISDMVVAVNGVWILVETFMLKGELQLRAPHPEWCTRLISSCCLCLPGGNFFSKHVPWSYLVFLTSECLSGLAGRTGCALVCHGSSLKQPKRSRGEI
jgi:hypothetical protein